MSIFSTIYKISALRTSSSFFSCLGFHSWKIKLLNPSSYRPHFLPRASLPVISDDRSNLLDQIKRGRELKHVEPGAGVSGGGGGGGGVGDLLSEIRKGKQLRPVSDDPSAGSAPPPQAELTGKRFCIIHNAYYLWILSYDLSISVRIFLWLN